MAIRRLILSNLSHRRFRSGLTVAAIALSVSLVVAVTSGYLSAETALIQLLSTYMGSNNVQISPKGATKQPISARLVRDIDNDPDVELVVGRLETEIVAVDPKGEPFPGPPASVIGVSRPNDAQVLSMKMDAGTWFDSDDADVCVIDQVASDKWSAPVGGTVTLVHADRKKTFTVVGVVHKPAILAAQIQTMYVPLRTLQRFVSAENQVSRVLVDLKTGADEAAFAARWTEKLKGHEPVLRIRRAGEARQQWEKNLEGVQFLSYMGGTVCMLAATFIIFATLSMGVTERTRSLAMLRAIGAIKTQVGLLVVLEGVLLALLGAAAGVPLGILWTHALHWLYPDIFSAGVVISLGGVLFATVGTLLSALVASFLPAYLAMRVDPLEAMAPLGQPSRPRIPLVAAFVGLVLISIDPVLTLVPGIPRDVTFYGHFALGLPGIFLGFFLLAPTFVILVDRTFGTLLTFLLRLNGPLLRQQLSGNLWRSAGTASALMVGLAILVVLQTQGNTMLSGWRLPDRFPDVFIVAPSGLTWSEQKVLDKVEGIKPGELMPIAIASPELGASMFAVGSASVMPDATMFFGVDPDKALDMMELEFRDGNPEDAKRMLKLGRHLIVTDEFRQLKGIKVGDPFPLKTTMNGTVEYTVAAVVWSPGLDVIVSGFDMGRQFDQRTAASVFGSLEDARRDFGIERVRLFAANLEIGLQKEDLAARMTKTLDEAATQPTTQQGARPWGGSFFSLQKLMGRLGFIVGDVRQIKHEMYLGFRKLLLLLSTVALAAIGVASLGVINTIMASVLSRRWQLGILRSIGVTRSQMVRLIVAEGLLLGLAGCALGLAAGLLMSLDANGLSRRIVGYGPRIQVPWDIVLLGVAIVLAVATLASLWPALSVARRQPLELLQWGRASA